MVEKPGKGQRDLTAPVVLFIKPNNTSWKQMLPIWVLLSGIAYLGIQTQLDNRLLAAGIILLGLLTSAFSWMLGVISFIPWIGSPLVKVLGLPVVWLLNALGYVVSFVAIRRGYTQDVLTYRGLTVALIIGIIIGYVLGKHI